MFLSLACAPIDCRVLRLPVAWPLCRMLLLRREECAAAAAPFASHDGLSQPALLRPDHAVHRDPLDGSLAWWDEDIRAFWGFVSSCGWVVASLPWRRRGPHRQAATQECTQIGENGLSTPFRGTCVHCCDAIRRGVNPHEPPKSQRCSRIGEVDAVGERPFTRATGSF